MTPRDAIDTGVDADVNTGIHQHLAAARLRMSTDFPYYAHGLFALQPVMTPGLGTLAVDSSWRLYVDPDQAMKWTVTELGTVLVHELQHVLRDHERIAANLGVTDDERTLWNVAADCAINDDLVEEHLHLPKGAMQPAMIGQPPGELEETYYKAVRTLQPAAKKELQAQAGRGFGPPSADASKTDVGCGSGADGVPRDWEVGDSADDAAGLSDVDAAMVRRRVALDILDHHASRGQLPAGLVRWATTMLEPVVDWRQVLRSELRAARTWVAGNTHSTYTRADRRADCRPGFIFPGTQQPTPEIAVVVDTSGSMDSDDLGTALAELDALLHQVAVRTLWVLSCDAKATPPERVHRLDGLQLVGGGGTDMRVGVAAAVELRPRPDIIVVFTDGDTPWPAAAPLGTRVVAMIIGGGTTPAPTGPGFSSVRVPHGRSRNRDAW